jgi:RES domain-containing protein
VSDPPRARLTAGAIRLIASRFPTVGVFDDIADSEEDLRAAFELEALTNTRLDATERLTRIPGGEVPSGGAGATLVMAAFLYASAGGGRFSDPRLGAWYASADIQTALAETIYHHERRLRASAAGFPARIQMRELLADLDDDFIDLRGLQSARPELYHPTDYSASQAFAAGVRWPFAAQPQSGVVYDSVRRAGGTNICVWRPMSVPLPVEQADHYEYNWDRSGTLTVIRLTGVTV